VALRTASDPSKLSDTVTKLGVAFDWTTLVLFLVIMVYSGFVRRGIELARFRAAETVEAVLAKLEIDTEHEQAVKRALEKTLVPLLRPLINSAQTPVVEGLGRLAQSVDGHVRVVQEAVNTSNRHLASISASSRKSSHGAIRQADSLASLQACLIALPNAFPQWLEDIKTALEQINAQLAGPHGAPALRNALIDPANPFPQRLEHIKSALEEIKNQLAGPPNAAALRDALIDPVNPFPNRLEHIKTALESIHEQLLAPPTTNDADASKVTTFAGRVRADLKALEELLKSLTAEPNNPSQTAATLFTLQKTIGGISSFTQNLSGALSNFSQALGSGQGRNPEPPTSTPGGR
jgi:hypothetical protein